MCVFFLSGCLGFRLCFIELWFCFPTCGVRQLMQNFFMQMLAVFRLSKSRIMNKESLSSVLIMVQYIGPWTQMKDWSYRELNPNFLREYKKLKLFYIIFKWYLSHFLIMNIFLTYFFIWSMPVCFLTLPFCSQACYHVIRRLIGFNP